MNKIKNTTNIILFTIIIIQSFIIVFFFFKLTQLNGKVNAFMHIKKEFSKRLKPRGGISLSNIKGLDLMGKEVTIKFNSPKKEKKYIIIRISDFCNYCTDFINAFNSYLDVNKLDPNIEVYYMSAHDYSKTFLIDRFKFMKIKGTALLQLEAFVPQIYAINNEGKVLARGNKPKPETFKAIFDSFNKE